MSFNLRRKVSLFVRLWVEKSSQTVRALTYSSASSWGCELKNVTVARWCNQVSCQPLREAVSWKSHCQSHLESSFVSLFVRLWVEKIQLLESGRKRWSASSWGCELKKWCIRYRVLNAKSASSWGCELKFLKNFEGIICIVVSLFVRLWVEMLWYPAAAYSESSASSWGCELKYINIVQSDHTSGQPLREAVSWNNGTQINQSPTIVSLFVRLWVEMLQT